MSKADFSVVVGDNALTFNEDDQETIGITIHQSGHRSEQEARIVLSNENQRWTAAFPAMEEITISIGSAGGALTEIFNGFIDRIENTEGYPGQLIITCTGHSRELAASTVRPLVYSDDLPTDERDGAGVSATVSGGEIQLPPTAKFIPIFDIESVTSGEDVITILAVDKENGLIFVDPIHNGESVKVNYSVFKAVYEEETATDILQDLFDRHGIAHLAGATIPTIATTLTLEPTIGDSLLDVWGQIRDILGATYDFYVNTDHEAVFVQRSGTSVRTVKQTDRDVRATSFVADYQDYANTIIATSGTGTSNQVKQDIGPFKNEVEGLSPSGTQIDAFAQGFKSLDEEVLDIAIKGIRETQNDAIGIEIQYNGKRQAIDEDFTTTHSLTPDSSNIEIDAGNDRIHVKTNGAGTAYFSNEWWPDLTQGSHDSNDNITGNIYQSVTVSGLTRTDIKGVAIKTPTATGSEEIKFELYSGGSGNSGTLLATSETVTWESDTEMETEWLAAPFSEVVDVSGETTVSIVAVMVSGTMAWYRHATSQYAGGAASSGGDFTFQFFTKKTVQDTFAAVAKWTDTVSNTNATPQFYIARDYNIGLPDAAMWKEVYNNSARLLTSSGSMGDKIGFKVSFNSLSTTSDPLLSETLVSVAYTDPSDTLDEPSGIATGDHQDITIDASDLPFFNPNTGSFTTRVSFGDSRLDKNGNYWLIGRDGNQEQSVSFYSIYYDDGADETLTETWDDEDNVASSSNLDVSSGEASIDRNEIDATMQSGDLLTASGTITDALYVSTEKSRGGRVLPFVSRNHRNYYYPGRSTTTTNPALNTGELIIWQFDEGDVIDTVSSTRLFADLSGNGYDIWTECDIVTGKFGNAVTAKGPGFPSSATGAINDPQHHLGGDWSVALWINPNTLSATKVSAVLCGDDDGRKLFQIGVYNDNKVKVLHTHGDIAGTETFASTGTPIATGTWTHVVVTHDISAKEYKIWLDGSLDSTHNYTNYPDTKLNEIGSLKGVLGVGESHDNVDGVEADFDEVRVWTRVIDSDTINLVKDYPYTSGDQTKFTFPSEADGTDDFTTADSADASKDDLRLYQKYLAAPFYEDGVWLFTPFTGTANMTNSAEGGQDLSSYAHTTDSDITPNNDTPTFVKGGPLAWWADFDGAANVYAYTNNDNLHFTYPWTFMWYMQHDDTSDSQTLFHKRGEIKIEAEATSSSLTDLTVTIECADGTTRTKTFSGLSIGTSQAHVALTYDGETLTCYVDGSSAGSNDFGDAKRVASSTNSLVIGAANASGDTASDFYDGKLALIWGLSYVATTSQITDMQKDPARGLRSPSQQSYVAAAYAGSGTKRYSDGKYLVSRDDEDSWTDDLDGNGSNANGSLAFRLRFGKSTLRCVRKDQTEIDRVGFPVERSVTITATDLETLCSAAEGALALYKNGIERGKISLDGDETFTVGDIITVDWPDKGQSSKEYAVASVQHAIEGGDWKTSLEVGEEERFAEVG